MRRNGWIPTAALAATLLFGSTVANAGIITAGYASGDSNPCGTQSRSSTGIITAGLTGIITAGFTGIITAGYTGIITAGFNTGIIVTDSATQTTRSCGIIVTD